VMQAAIWNPLELLGCCVECCTRMRVLGRKLDMVLAKSYQDSEFQVLGFWQYFQSAKHFNQLLGCLL
jgi:hypothetical protein